MRRKLYSEEHYSDAIKAQLAEMRAKRAKKNLEKQIAKAEKQIGHAVTEKFKESLAKTLSDTSMSSKAKAKSIRTSTLSYKAKSSVSQNNKFAAGNGDTAYTKKFADAAQKAWEYDVKLAKYQDEPGIADIRDGLGNLFSTLTSNNMDYEGISEDSVDTVDSVTEDINYAIEDAESNGNLSLISLLDEVKVMLDESRMLLKARDISNTL